MVFSSIPFLFAFLPAVILVERAVSGIRAKNAVLLAASILFYAYGEPVYVFLMLASVVVNHNAARWIAACGDNGKKVLWIEAGAVLFNLGMLYVFKYAGMTVSLLNQGLHTALPVPKITLPIGISFYTFQALSYVVDVRRGTAPAQKSIFSTALYLSFFPQLIAGPIVKYSDISMQMLERKEDPQQTAQGIRRFVAGLSKKVILANQLGHMTDLLRTIPAGETGMLWSWAAAVSYALHIYFDFSGYSDMAIGLGKIFGFTFKENFRDPYTAASVKDFWRRWHISLSSWFRDYLYIPLGGNRKGTARTVVNKLFVFACTGMWHGANLAFLVWGLWHGFFLMAEELVSKCLRKPDWGQPDRKQDRKNKMLWLRLLAGKFYTFVVAVTGFVFFQAGMELAGSKEAIQTGWNRICAMFVPGFSELSGRGAAVAGRTADGFTAAVFFAAILIVCLSPGLRGMSERITKNTPVLHAVSSMCTILLVIACMAALSGGAYNPFIYFQF